MVTALLLAAGASSRMGRPKGLLPLDGVPLLLRHLERHRAAGHALRVVLGGHAEAYRAVLPPDVDVVVNPAWATTEMATSLALGLEGVGRALVSPVDVPPPRPATLAALLDGVGDAVPTWRGVDGHPVRLDPPHPPGRLDLRLRPARRVPVDDPDCVLDFDTPDAWARWCAGRASP